MADAEPGLPPTVLLESPIPLFLRLTAREAPKPVCGVPVRNRHPAGTPLGAQGRRSTEGQAA